MTLHNTEEAAEILGITTRTLRRLVRAGNIPCFRIGRTLRFSIEEILDKSRQCRREEDEPKVLDIEDTPIEELIESVKIYR